MGTENERSSVRRLQAAIDAALRSTGEGYSNGHEFGEGNFQIFLVGRNPDKLLETTEMCIRQYPDLRLEAAIKRYVIDPDKEIEVRLELPTQRTLRTSERKKRRKAFGPGEVFLIPLIDGTFGVGQVLAKESVGIPSVSVGLFDWKITTFDPTKHHLSRDHAVSSLFVTPDLIEYGLWPIVGKKKIEIPRSLFPHEEKRRSGWVGADVIGSANVAKFMNSYFGLNAWNAMADPEYYDKLLLVGRARPDDAIMLDNKTIH